MRNNGSAGAFQILVNFANVFWPEHTPQINTTDPRFQFVNLHAYGKTGWLLCHIFPPYSSCYHNLREEGSQNTNDYLEFKRLSSVESVSDDNEEPEDIEIIFLLCQSLKMMFKLKSIPIPAAYYVTRWNSDAFSMGSYSYSVGRVDHWVTL